LVLRGEVAHERVGAHALELPGPKGRPEIPQRSYRRRRGKTGDEDGLRLVTRRVDPHAGARAARVARDGDVDELRHCGDKGVERSGGTMARDRGGTGGQQRGAHAADVGERRMTDGVDAAEDDREAPAPYAMVDRVLAHAVVTELVPARNTVLRGRERRRDAVDGDVRQPARARPRRTSGVSIAGNVRRGARGSGNPTLTAEAHAASVPPAAPIPGAWHGIGTQPVGIRHEPGVTG
jgi:hypothetical protein